MPVGSTEQHGPHLPLSTDTDLAVALCAGLARACPGAVIAPPLAYGSSGEHQDFAGTLSIGQAALELVLVELCTQLRTTGTFPGHVLLVCDARRQRGRRPPGGAPPGGRVPRRPGLAGVLARRRPRRAHRDLASAGPGARPGPAGPGRAGQHPSHRRAHLAVAAAGVIGVRAVSANGVLGDPVGASAAEGTRLLAALLAADLLDTVGAWYARENPGSAAPAPRHFKIVGGSLTAQGEQSSHDHGQPAGPGARAAPLTGLR